MERAFDAMEAREWQAAPADAVAAEPIVQYMDFAPPASELVDDAAVLARLATVEAALEQLRRATTGPLGDHFGTFLNDVLRALPTAADLGFRGLDNDVRGPVIVTGFHASRTHKLTPGQKTANRVLAVERAQVEHGFAHLKNWRTLTKLRTEPAHPTRLLRALLVLTNLEANR
ncbi:transposase family protein [Streptomyces mirabilis]|uniref:transposase family protein n=1 Tax=Streptomyces mirabilis TaxID=68239 RepID=UPI00365D5A90